MMDQTYPNRILNGSHEQHPCTIHSWTRLKPSKHNPVAQIINSFQAIVINGTMRMDSLISNYFAPISSSRLSLPPLIPTGKFISRNMKREVVRYCLKYILNSYSWRI